MKGRKRIYTDVEVITAQNVVEQVNAALLIHQENQTEIQYLYDFLRGEQDIQAKTKEYRTEINHKVTENRAYQIHSFYHGYVFGETIQYVRHEKSTGTSNETDDTVSKEITALNAFMNEAEKDTVDKHIGSWMLTCGVGYRLTLPREDLDRIDYEDSPVRMYSMDPRSTFVVYYSGFDHHPVFSVTITMKRDGTKRFDVYTADAMYTYEYPLNVPVESAPPMASIVPHGLGRVPIVEYDLNTERMGVFEAVIPLLNAINEFQSNRMDDIVQFVDSMLVILGGDISEETFSNLQQYKTLALPDGVDAKYVGKQMNQNDIQSLKQDLLTAVYEICGLPNRSGGSGRSTSDTGAATLVRDGWEDAEKRAQSMVGMFQASEREFLRMTLGILRETKDIDLRLQDIDVHFTRRNYENISIKAQVLTMMLDNPKIDPQLAFEACGMFIDPEAAYLQSKKYAEEAGYDGSGGNQVSGMPEEADESGGPVPDTMPSV